jgi:hypothetical protein
MNLPGYPLAPASRSGTRGKDSPGSRTAPRAPERDRLGK